MNIAILRQLHEARPFKPFTMTLADGRKLNVPHNEFLSFFPSGRAAILFSDHDDGFTLIDLLMVTSADMKPSGHRRTKRA